MTARLEAGRHDDIDARFFECNCLVDGRRGPDGDDRSTTTFVDDRSRVTAPNTKLKAGGLASSSAETCWSKVAHPRNGNTGGGTRSSRKNGASGTSAAS